MHTYTQARFLGAALTTITMIAGQPTFCRADEAALKGFGSGTCADYANAARLDQTEADLMFFTWAQGYLSGVNMERLLKRQPVLNLSDDHYQNAAQLTFLHAYCNQHPLAPFMTAVLALSQDMWRTVPAIHGP
jgi:hypothetical protein